VSSAAENVARFINLEEEQSDDHLITRTLAGDTDAFGILVRRWERPIYGLALRMLGRDEDAREACQEAFFAAFRNLGKFRGEAKFSSWIYRIALNACHTRLRAGSIVAFSLDEPNEDGQVQEIPDAEGAGAAEQVSQRQRTQLVRKALQALPPEMRQVIVMKEYEEMTFAEISDVLSLPISTVKSRLYTGLQQMRMRLEHLRGAV
jgi:RNA polymerase sigma-70 factor (ECF subfamily)